MTGYSIGEYIRCRRLYLAALEVIASGHRVIDLAYKYGYDTPESFTRAFTRFHGISPAALRSSVRRASAAASNSSGQDTASADAACERPAAVEPSAAIRTFLPLRITVSVKGGNEMDYVVEKMEAFEVIGYGREFSPEDSYQKIPSFWCEFCDACVNGKNDARTQAVIKDCMVGEFGICAQMSEKSGSFTYLIAGRYHGGEVPDGMRVLRMPAMEWARFRCVGPLPGALQAVNTRIFQEWLPGNPEYEMAADINVEWYSDGDTGAADYLSEIWIPVRKR